MSINIIKKDSCTGCLACINSCPLQCITYYEDSCGFSNPQVVSEICIECGKCEKICPLLSSDSLDKYKQKVYAAWSNDSDVRFFSTSGGMFTEIARKIVEMGGYVCAACYTTRNNVEHVVIHDYKEIKRLSQSKYVQSNTKDIYKKVYELLKNGNIVLFVGTPCQVAAVKNYCKKVKDKLYCVDFICRGVNSPKAYKAWIHELEKKYKSNVKRVWFRYKYKGWKKSSKTTRIEFKNEKKIILRDYNNSFMKGYLGPNLYIRTSCSDCKFKGANRVSDITLGDFWGIEAELDDDKGTSLVIINSERGNKLVNSISHNITIIEKDIESIVSGNQCFNTSININKRSQEFLENLGPDTSFSSLVNSYVYDSYFKRYLSQFKSVIKYMIGK